MPLALSWSRVPLGRVDPLAGAAVAVTEARAESVTFQPPMPTPVQTVAMARPAVPVPMVGSSRKETQVRGASSQSCFLDAGYEMEELVAGLGSAFLCDFGTACT